MLEVYQLLLNLQIVTLKVRTKNEGQSEAKVNLYPQIYAQPVLVPMVKPCLCPYMIGPAAQTTVTPSLCPHTFVP